METGNQISKAGDLTCQLAVLHLAVTDHRLLSDVTLTASINDHVAASIANNAEIHTVFTASREIRT